MKKHFIIGIGGMLLALAATAQTSTVQHTAPTIHSPNLTVVQPSSQGNTLKSTVAPSIGEAVTTTHPNHASTSGSSQATQAGISEEKISKESVKHEKE